MILTKNALLDGMLSFERGVDTYRSPSRVPRNQACLLVNSTTRQDFLAPRPYWKQVKLKFITYNENTGKYTIDAALQAAFEDGYFQGFSGYTPDKGPSHLIFSVSGKLYRVEALGNGTVQALTMPGGDNPAKRPLSYYAQGECFLFHQDGQSVPLIYNGASLRRSDTLGLSGKDADGRPLTEIPVGTCMAYSGGRMWVALPDGMHFVAGDGVYGPTGTAAYQQRDSIIRFTENNYLNGGWPFAIPAAMGPIRAMVPLANLDTSLGQGPLQVFTPSGCFSVQAPLDRALWALINDPIKTVSLLDQGALSQRGCINVNGDVWYRSMDGIRSFMIARRDFGTWGNRAMSFEVTKHLSGDDWTLLDRHSAALFDNRLIESCAPRNDSDHGVYHRGLVVLDFLPLTSISKPDAPAWDGLWVGHDILQVATVESEAVQHCFAAVLAPADDNGMRKIQLWELQRTTGPDIPLNLPAVRIASVFESPRFDFGSKVEQKMLEACEIWIDNISSTVDFTLYYRPNEHQCWLLWKTWTVCATTQRCAGDEVDGCMPSMNLRTQFRSRIGALRPPDYTIDGTGETSRLGYSFQIRLERTGQARVLAIRLLANRIVEASFGSPADAACQEVICCEPNDFEPPSSGGGNGSGEMVGIVEENPDIWITTEDGTVVRAEHQPQTTDPDNGTGGGGSGGGGVTPDDPTTQPGLPEWPVLTEFSCGTGTHAYFADLAIDGSLYGAIEPMTLVEHYVGINPGALDPIAYLDSLGAAGIIQPWCDAVWASFVAKATAAGLTWSQARLVWRDVPVGGDQYFAVQVFNTPAGPWNGIVSLDTRIDVELCLT